MSENMEKLSNGDFGQVIGGRCTELIRINMDVHFLTLLYFDVVFRNVIV